MLNVKETPKDSLFSSRYCDSCGESEPNTLIGFTHNGVALCDECLMELRNKITERILSK